MGKIKWLQLSDLHFGDESSYSSISRRALVGYIERENLAAGIDYIFVTGDIIYAKNLGNSKSKVKAYSEAVQYLRNIYLSIWKDDDDFKLITKRMFLVPGNHDLIRDKSREGSVDYMDVTYRNDYTGNIEESFLDNTRRAMQHYNGFYHKLTNKQMPKTFKKQMHYVIETEKANILHINTCISSCKDDEEGKLLLGFKLINEAVNSINTGKPTIVIAHHDIECFEKIEQRRLEILLKQNNIFLYLCGHSHARESSIVMRYNQMKVLNSFTCGTLMAEDRSDIKSTVFLVGEMDVDSKEGLIKSYKWEFDSGWCEDSDFGSAQNIKGNYRSFNYNTVQYGNDYSFNTEGVMNGLNSKLVSIQSSERNKAFYDMNDRAANSLSIYGVGLTNVSRNDELLDKILDNGGTVRLCMVNPEIFKNGKCFDNNCCGIDSYNFCIYSDHIDQYVRKEYYEDIKRSYKRLLEYKALADKKRGRFELRLLNSFVPISINIINEDTENAELIVEYDMAFTSKRLLLGLNKANHGEYYGQVKDVFENIWQKAVEA